MQWAAAKGEAPFDLRLPFMIPPFHDMWAGAHWEMENLALFNQAAYSGVVKRASVTDELWEEHQRMEAIPASDDEDEGKQVALARLRETATANEIESEAIARYADEVTVVATWAFVEKLLNRGLTALQTALGQPLITDHRWPNINAAFQQCGIDLSAASGFADADECRKVNNAIKHAGVVSNALAALPAFAGKAGSALTDLELDTQRYFFGAGDFTSAVLETCSDVVKALPAPSP
jgi:hypothetical protein